MSQGAEVLRKEAPSPTFWAVTWRATIVHSVTYLAAGIVALILLDYGELFGTGHFDFIRSVDDPLVMAGPLFQPLRGLLFGVVFYLLRASWYGKTHGWLTMWITLIFLGVFATFGPAIGSLEGFVYTTIPIQRQLLGWSEVLPQALLLAAITVYWVAHPKNRWLNWGLGIIFAASLVLPAMGLMFG